ncbi:MAG: LPS export ABC transporter periplasmic protein LptC [Thainema sp.]
MKNGQWTRPIGVCLAITLIGGGLVSCDRRNRAADQIAEDSSAVQEQTSNLTFENITLSQSDEAGNPVWSIKAEEANYSPDQKIATVTNPIGDLLQDGEKIYNVEAKTAEVHQDGEVIYLRGDVVATDTRDGAVLKGEELEWRPQANVIFVRGGIQGTHPKMNASAQEAKVMTRDRTMEITGKVIATTKDPNVRLQSEKILWNLQAETVVSPVPIKVERYEGNQIIDTVTGKQAEVKLQENLVRITEDALLTLREPPVQVSSNNMFWNLGKNTIVSNQPIRIVHQTEGVTLTADTGRMDLEQEIVYLSQNVQAVGQRDGSQLNANELTWIIPTQQVNARGNVRYRQTDPPFNLRGDQAVGRLENQTVVVRGGPVITEIIPQ